jgi:hypothetical protein
MTSKPLTPEDRARWLATMPKGAVLPDNVREVEYRAGGRVTALSNGDALELREPDANALLAAVDAEAEGAVEVLVQALVLAGITPERAFLIVSRELALDEWLVVARQAALDGKPLSVEAEERLDKTKARATVLAQRVNTAVRECDPNVGRVTTALRALRED